MVQGMVQDANIATLRGFAIILVVVGHIIGGLLLTEGGLYQFYELLKPYRMPLFTVLSGYVYALWPLSREHTGVFLGKKARRLLLPFLVYTPIFLALQVIFPTNAEVSWSDLPARYMSPAVGLWYLPALMGIFLGVALVENTTTVLRERKLASFLCFGLLLLCSHWILETGLLFGWLAGMVYLLPFFVLGIWVKQVQGWLLASRGLKVLLLLLVLAAMATQVLGFADPAWAAVLGGSKHGLLYLLLSSAGVVGLFCLRWDIGLLAYIGRYSYTIFLMHSVPTVAARVVFKEPYLVVILGTLLGIGLPIIAHKVLIQNRFTSLVLLGIKARPGAG